MPSPRVSIIVPAYNAELFLPETLGSVEAQTYASWEAVIADDASTDGTVKAAEAFGERFKVLRGDVNAGPASARNRAIREAGGELLAFLDADDLWLPEYLDRLVCLYDESRDRGENVGIVTCDARILEPAGYRTETYMQLNGFPDDVSVNRMLVANPIFVGALVPRALVEEAGGFCEDLFGTEDWDLWLRIVERGYGVASTREALVVYRRRPASVSASLARMARNRQLTYRRALSRGALTPSQERVARRQLRLQRAVEQVGLIMSERGEGRNPTGLVLRKIPLFLRVAVENPGRWGPAVRYLAGRGSPLVRGVK
jgi:glycosyltransferase involved in cell wall biosynthesis